ncbi:carbamoyltransferase family protein [Geothermobacter hydrogeniphilus]|uniref:Carbamoyltransferase n=1 Tax=Geothermobacter hydrogeniphilus TaxID=1969733 RepID=A0A1X0YB94_9BACT|nr:carbamoyltransferase [Geothermobacter hydrogeniphilus]ORJ62363.1 hypothetical protein B5V00_03495 [Geothermobacter hydrogeniphilus]
MNILGLSAYYHDSAACLVRDGRIVAAAQEERFSRKKHDAGFPLQSLTWCLEQARLSSDDLDAVVFYEKPFLRFERLLETYLAFAPRGLKQFLTALPVWMKEKIWIKEAIRKHLDYQGPIYFPEHHQSHAASAFFPSPFEESAVLTLDGVGEWSTVSFGRGCGNRLDLLGEIRFPHSLGLLYSAFTYYMGFKVNSGEYKVMGLAPYGEPRYVQRIRDEIIDLKEDGSFRLNMDYFNFATGLTMTNERFHKLFEGPPRKPESELTTRDMDLARSIQVVTEEAVLRMGHHVHQETGSPHLCMAGGVALNCVANGRLLREGPFEKIWVQPASGDAGAAVGAALFGWYVAHDKERKVQGGLDSMSGSYLGPDYSEEAIGTILDKYQAPRQRLEEASLLKRTAELLASGHVVGWFQGRMEFGPRALGNRSILADARSPEMQTRVNLKIKFREGFRPFAPAIREERVRDYFDHDAESPYMLLTAQVKAEKLRRLTEEESQMSGFARLRVARSEIPAVTHVDNSARLQTVSAVMNPLFHNLLLEFERLTGCPVLINTSFNVRGEPIVCTPEDAYRCFMGTGMDYLVVGPFLLDKRLQPEWQGPSGAKELD